ncbi:sugar nucleotide-binding protein [Vibrio sp. La 4.2.2]|uniref:sugar nucleotide-binding protein n=1 Tax=Vibrio sp. La 4.2.2 TaxID=2998830 RepID=UPI0022CE2C4F|nr:sugar nucleotide-binding protein [Vibrio sp. La 4.2.2]MDA0110530.1 sugar nucleotide-binding protein [Vibrio sp. La 4.2.2]
MIHVVVGASGYLGSSILSCLSSEEHVIATYRTKKEPIANEEWKQLDVGNLTSIDEFFSELDADEQYTFYYLAALHHPDKVEEDWQLAWDINITGLAYFLSRLPDNSDLIYSSTDNVYGESKNFVALDESSIKNPVNEYGKQKLLAESMVLSRGLKVARYCFLIGPSKISKPHFYDVIIESCISGDGIGLMTDSYRSVISFDKAAEYSVELMKKFYQVDIGPINISSDDVMSKYDIGFKIVDKKYHDKISKISIRNSSVFKAKRPENVILCNDKLKMLLLKDELKFYI